MGLGLTNLPSPFNTYINNLSKHGRSQSLGYKDGQHATHSQSKSTKLHPQTHLPTSGPTNNPILTPVETSHRWHGGDTITTELGQLIAVGAVDVDEAVHVSDAEALDG